VRHPPQSGWLSEWGRLKGGRPVGLGVALKRASDHDLETPFRSIRFLLVADVLADFIEVQPDRRDSIASGLELFAGEVLLSTTQAGNGYGALPFQKPNHRSYGMAKHMCTWIS